MRIIMKWSTFGLIAFLCSFSAGEIINHGDNSEDAYISYANITAKSTSETIPLYDTYINFDTEKLEEKTYTVKVCPVLNESEIDTCSQDRVIVTNATAEKGLKRLLKRAYHEKSSSAFIIMAEGKVDLEEDTEFPRLVFTTNIMTYFSSQDPDEEYTIYHYYGVNCPAVEAPKLFFTFSFIGSGILLIMWAISLYWLYKRQVVCIHKIILYLAMMKVGIDGVYLLRILTCSPFTDPIMLALAKTAGSTIFYAFTSALGISITTDAFIRKQFVKVLVVTLYSYLSYSTYYIFGLSNVIIQMLARILLASFSGYMVVNVVSMCMENITSLYAEARRVDSPELNDIRKGLVRKMWMYSIFGSAMVIYYVATMAEHGYLLVVEVTDKTQYWLEGIEALECWVVYLAIMCIFHPCFFTASFRLGQIIPRELQQQRALEDHEDIPFLTVNLKAGNEVTEGISKKLGRSIIVQTPGEHSKQSIFGILVSFNS